MTTRLVAGSSHQLSPEHASVENVVIVERTGRIVPSRRSYEHKSMTAFISADSIYPLNVIRIPLRCRYLNLVLKLDFKYPLFAL